LDAADKNVVDDDEEEATAPRTATADRINGDGEKACTEISTAETRYVRTNDFILFSSTTQIRYVNRGDYRGCSRTCLQTPLASATKIGRRTSDEVQVEF
jgi:hypothetical protein